MLLVDIMCMEFPTENPQGSCPLLALHLYTLLFRTLSYSLPLLTLEKREITERVCWVSVSRSQILGVVFSSSFSLATCWLREFKQLNSLASWFHPPLNGTVCIHPYSPIAHGAHRGDDILANNR